MVGLYVATVLPKDLTTVSPPPQKKFFSMLMRAEKSHTEQKASLFRNLLTSSETAEQLQLPLLVLSAERCVHQVHSLAVHLWPRNDEQSLQTTAPLQMSNDHVFTRILQTAPSRYSN